MQWRNKWENSKNEKYNNQKLKLNHWVDSIANIYKEKTTQKKCEKVHEVEWKYKYNIKICGTSLRHYWEGNYFYLYATLYAKFMKT